MAHTKAQGAASRTVDVEGKRRGVKKFSGEVVKSGNIIVKQLGTKFYPGENTGMGRDFTIFATAPGTVKYTNLTGFKKGRKKVHVNPIPTK